MEVIKIEGSYIEYVAGYDKENITLSDLEKALTDLPQMDDEHGAFSIGVHGSNTDEFILELHKGLTLFWNFGEEENYKIKLNNLDSAKIYFILLLEGRIDELKKELKNN